MPDIAFVEITVQVSAIKREKRYYFFVNKESAQKYYDAYVNDTLSWVSNIGECQILDNGNIVPLLEEDD